MSTSAATFAEPLSRDYLVALVDRLEKFPLDVNTPQAVRSAILRARYEAWDALLKFSADAAAADPR